ncbi:MAG: hypothetical protein GY841_21755 [FCB group bacterium]|nr:hypothetical protein [FCB group bacterium]
MPSTLSTSIIAVSIILLSITGCGKDNGSGNSTDHGIYAELMVRRNVNNSGYGPAESDVYEVHLDGLYAPDGPINPIDSAEVKCNGDSLGWAEYADAYYYPVLQTAGKFLQLGGTYNFTVTADERLPALSQSIIFPRIQPWLNTPEWGDTLQLDDDLTIAWDNAGIGDVEISITLEGVEKFFIKVPNSGSYTITEDKLSELDDGRYFLILDYYTRAPITAAGYDSRGFIRARVHNFSLVTFQ